MQPSSSIIGLFFFRHAKICSRNRRYASFTEHHWVYLGKTFEGDMEVMLFLTRDRAHRLSLLQNLQPSWSIIVFFLISATSGCVLAKKKVAPGPTHHLLWKVYVGATGCDLVVFCEDAPGRTHLLLWKACTPPVLPGRGSLASVCATNMMMVSTPPALPASPPRGPLDAITSIRK